MPLQPFYRIEATRDHRGNYIYTFYEGKISRAEFDSLYRAKDFAKGYVGYAVSVVYK